MSPPVEAVFLDAGNTLIFVDPERVLEAFGDFGVHADPGRFTEAEHRARLELTLQVGDGSRGTEAHVWRDYFVTLFRECGVPEELTEAVGERIRRMHEELHLWTFVDPATPPALALLREVGYRLGVISNADGRVEKLLEKVELRPHFEFVIDSQVFGVEKPDSRIFLEGCSRAGLDPGVCLYVGDLFPVDVLGARAAGLQAVLLDPLGRLDYPVDRIPSVAHLPEYLAARDGSPS